MLKYATLTKQLVRADTVLTEMELKTKGIKPATKVLSNGSPKLIIEQKWKQDIGSLLTANTWEELLAIEDKAVAIVHGLCEPQLITIDIDSKQKADSIIEIVNSLPETQKPLLITKGIGKAGYHIMYHNTEANRTMLDYVYKIHKGGLGDSLDVLASSDKVLFIGNRGNKTKELVYINPNANTLVNHSIPIVLQYTVMALFKDTPVPVDYSPAKELGQYLPEHTNTQSDLGFLFNDFVPDDSTTSLLFNNFIARRAKEDLKVSFIAPEEEEYPYQPKYYTGTPNDLLFRLSGSLKNDIGIDKQKHKLIIETINNLLPHQKNHTQLQSEILGPDTKEPYMFNKDWESATAALVNSNKEVISIYRLTKHTAGTTSHMLHNINTGEIRLFKTPGDLLEELMGEVVGLRKPTLKKIQEKARTVDLLERPDKPFGLIEPNKNSVNRRYSFNIYRRTDEQKMFYEPEETMLRLRKTYSRPDTIIAAIESQFGAEKTHSLFLPFIKRKLLTHEPTPLIFVLMGVPHSFKTGLVEGLLKPLFSSHRYLKTNGEILTEKYNDYLVNLDILFVDEFHHLVGTPHLKTVIQTLNKFGSEYHEGIRSMYSSVQKGLDVHQEVTPFITMNKVVVPATESVGERRLVVAWGKKPVREALNLSDEDIKQMIKSELLDFAYYLATEVGVISAKDYSHNRAWKEIDSDYYDFMQEGISLPRRVAMAFGMTNEDPNIKQLLDICPDLKNSVVKLSRSTHGSMYRLRIWTAQDGAYRSPIPGLLDHLEDIDRAEITKILNVNEKVLPPSIVSTEIRCMKQDYVISEVVLRDNGLITETGEPLYTREDLLIGD